MATASTSTPPLSPAFSTAHFQWPTHPHSYHFPAPSSFHPHQSNHHSLSFDLPDFSSTFGHSSHTAVFADSTGLSSPDSPDAEAESSASLYSAAAHFPLSSSSPSSSSSAYSPTPSPTPAPLLPAHRQQNNSRRRRRQTDEPTDEHQPLHHTYPYADHDANDNTARRLKHRQIDAARRVREQSAISRLQQLTQRLTHIPHFDQQQCTSTKRSRAADTKKDKVSVLEETADRMESLYGLIEQLSAACMSQYDDDRSRVYQQKPFPPPSVIADRQSHSMLPLLPTYPSYAPHSTHSQSTQAQSQRVESATAMTTSSNTSAGRHSLYSVFFLSASLPMLTVRCDTGQVLDVNSAALALSGWQPHHMIGKRITAPYELIMSSKPYDDAKPELCCPSDSDPLPVEEKDGRMVNARFHQQYETSNEQERKLYGGEVSVIQAVWRLQLKNGRLHEMTATQWCGEWMEVADGSGGVRRRPTYVVYVISPESIIRVD